MSTACPHLHILKSMLLFWYKLLSTYHMKILKKDVPFTMVANEVLYRTDLSLKAKGLFAYLFSKPEGWDFSGDRIVAETKEGRKVVYSALKDLENAGLLKRERQPDGKMIYTLEYSDESLLPKKDNRAIKPTAQNGQEPKRPRAKRGSISNKENTSNKEKKVISKTSEPKYTGIDLELAENLNAKIIYNFPELEKKKVDIFDWAQDIRKLRDINKATPEQISFMITWVHGGYVKTKRFEPHEFWAKNILSAGKLRKQWYTLVPQLQTSLNTTSQKEKVAQL